MRYVQHHNVLSFNDDDDAGSRRSIREQRFPIAPALAAAGKAAARAARAAAFAAAVALLLSTSLPVKFL